MLLRNSNVICLKNGKQINPKTLKKIQAKQKTEQNKHNTPPKKKKKRKIHQIFLQHFYLLACLEKIKLGLQDVMLYSGKVPSRKNTMLLILYNWMGTPCPNPFFFPTQFSDRFLGTLLPPL